MKINKLLRVASILTCMGMLSGCQLNNQSGMTSGTQLSQQISQLPQYSASDEAAYQGAQQLKDPEFCDKIQNEEYKQQCKTDIVDQTQLEEAIAKSNADLCAKIISQDKQKACQIRVEVKQQEIKDGRKRDIESQTLYEQFNKILVGGDATKCKTLKDGNLALSCEKTILTNQAISTKDQSWCDKISQEESRQECKNATASM